MSETPKALEQMLNAWNELDHDAVRGHLDKALAEDVVFIDPTHSTVGRDAFETMVHDFRPQFPLAGCSRSSVIDCHHNLYRYNWESHQGGELLVPGFDVAEINDAGQVCRVEGFFGPLPPVAAD